MYYECKKILLFIARVIIGLNKAYHRHNGKHHLLQLPFAIEFAPSNRLHGCQNIDTFRHTESLGSGDGVRFHDVLHVGYNFDV
jgi:hypothetical protein